MNPLQYLIALIINLLAGIILYYWLPFMEKNPNKGLIIIGIIGMSTLFTLGCILGRWIFLLKKKGIVDLLLSMTKGKGSTTSILKGVKDQFSFMGIAASKWVNTGPILEEVIKKVALKRPVRFLLLNPNSDAARIISRTQRGDENSIPNQILSSINRLEHLKQKGFQIQLRLYSFLPIFRIAIVNDKIAYLGFYRASTHGQDSPQLVLDRHPDISFFQPFQEYFDEIWKYNSDEYQWKEEGDMIIK